jgi:hypothetical protein
MEGSEKPLEIKSTILALIRGNDRTVSVEINKLDLEFNEFMEMIEMVIVKSGYSDHEIESYILEWAEAIRHTREN